MQGAKKNLFLNAIYLYFVENQYSGSHSMYFMYVECTQCFVGAPFPHSLAPSVLLNILTHSPLEPSELTCTQKVSLHVGSKQEPTCSFASTTLQKVTRSTRKKKRFRCVFVGVTCRCVSLYWVNINNQHLFIFFITGCSQYGLYFGPYYL